ncbi:lysine-specific demethylase JMJ13-like [Rutidosis leptorrhynchoides]|uniref:lysine-specific demethylase JMJ13-like n=1 Tax=Rutidosis leptorrhynchoides TaxID=125765 RepID=UPI003A9973DC
MPKKMNKNKLQKMSISKCKKLNMQSLQASKSTTHNKSCMLKNPNEFRADHGRNISDNLEWLNEITECPVYHPSFEEFEDPLRYIQKISPQASKYGVCKIVPPLISTTPIGAVINNEKPGFRFTPKVQPLRIAKWTTNDKNTFFDSRKSYSVRDFEVMANKASANRYSLSGCLPSAYVEREFWVEMTRGKKGTVEYGVNVDGSAFSSSSNDHLANSKWNLKKLSRLPRSPLRLMENDVPGVTDPMLYIGMLFSMFAWHVEDHYLYSINYHHCGAPKTWYGVPGSSADEFEKVVQHYVYTKEILSVYGTNGAFEMLAEKTTMFPPYILLHNHVPVYRVVQLPGEFVVTFPRAYHAGFSHGFNCGEAVNFAAGDWFPFGGAANEIYASLRKKPIIPYEEILCKEAIYLSSRRRKKDGNFDNDSSSERSVKTAFASLIQNYDGAILSLDPSLYISSNLKETISCTICKRDCYVAHVSCKCHADPMCVFHGKELSDCHCGSQRFVSTRVDLTEMKKIAKKFEEQLIMEAGNEIKREKCNSRGCNQYFKCQNGLGRAEYKDTQFQQSNASERVGKRSRKQRTYSVKKSVTGDDDVAAPVNKTERKGKVGISSKKRTNSSLD